MKSRKRDNRNEKLMLKQTHTHKKDAGCGIKDVGEVRLREQRGEGKSRAEMK